MWCGVLWWRCVSVVVYCWRLGLRYICHPLHLELRMPILINCPSVSLSFTAQRQQPDRDSVLVHTAHTCCTIHFEIHKLYSQNWTQHTAHWKVPTVHQNNYKVEAPCNDLTLHWVKAFIDCDNFKPHKTHLNEACGLFKVSIRFVLCLGNSDNSGARSVI